MRTNVGSVDGAVRILIGIGGLYAGYVSNGIFWYIVGTVAIITGLARHCPLYALFGIDSDDPYWKGSEHDGRGSARKSSPPAP